MDYLKKLNGMSQGSLELIRRELRENPQFAQHLKGLLEASDPKKAVFEDMLQAVQLYIRGEELEDWYWWDLIDEIERFVDDEMYIPRPGDEGAMLMRVLALKSIDAARAKLAYMNLPWKTYAKIKPVAGMAGGPLLFGLRTPAQQRKHHRHNRQRRLAAATPEERAAYLEGLAKRKEHRKNSTLVAKFDAAYKEFGGVAGQVISTIGGVVACFAPIGTIIGAGLVVAGTAITTHQQMMLARIASKAREREMKAIQDDYETGKIDADEHNKIMAAIMVEEGEKLAAEGKLPAEEATSVSSAGEVPTAPAPEPAVAATKENIAEIVVEKKLPDSVKVTDAGDLVDEENQYVIDLAAKMEKPAAEETGLAPAQDIAQGQKVAKTASTAMIMAAGAIPFILR